MRDSVPAGRPPTDEQIHTILQAHVPSEFSHIYNKVQILRLWESLYNDVLHQYRECILDDVLHDNIDDETILNTWIWVWGDNEIKVNLNVIHYEMKRVYEVRALFLNSDIFLTSSADGHQKSLLETLDCF